MSGLEEGKILELEYVNGAAYFRDLVRIRFTVVGGFFVFLALLLNSWEKIGLVLHVAVLIGCICFWVMEIRNRQLIDDVVERLIQIEKMWASSDLGSRFFTKHHRSLPDGRLSGSGIANLHKISRKTIRIRLFGIVPISFYYELSYSRAFDAMFSFIIISDLAFVFYILLY